MYANGSEEVDLMPRALSKPDMKPPGVPEAAFRELIRVMGLLERVMQPHFARFGISGSQWGLLRILDRAAREGEDGLRVTDLSDKLLVRPPSVTGAIDRLERAGLVQRCATPADQRVTQVRLTDKGMELVSRVLSVHERQIASVLGGLSAEEQMDFQRLLSRLSHHLAGMIGGVVAPVG